MKTYPKGLPCWAPGAADFLASILTGEENAVEWGGGQSTIWLSSRVKRILVVEHDPKWIKWIEERVPKDVVTVVGHPCDSKSYVGCVALVSLQTIFYKTERIGLWLIDGYNRIDCLDLVTSQAQEGDIVVCDDALDYAEHLLYKVEFIHRFDMPHPHAGLPCVSAKNTRDRNTVRTHAPATKETWVWRV